MKKKMGVFAAIKNTNKLQLKNNDLNNHLLFYNFPDPNPNQQTEVASFAALALFCRQKC